MPACSSPETVLLAPGEDTRLGDQLEDLRGQAQSVGEPLMLNVDEIKDWMDLRK